ncbi:hypothetical protein D3C73_1311650 [compost metagenome]
MTDSPAANVRLGDLLHCDGGLHPCRDLDLFERVLQSQRIHNRGQHPHIVCSCAVNSFGAACNAPPNVTASAYDGDLNSELNDFFHLLGDRRNRLGIDTVPILPGQRFTANLQDNTFKNWLFQLYTSTIDPLLK